MPDTSPGRTRWGLVLAVAALLAVIAGAAVFVSTRDEADVDDVTTGGDASDVLSGAGTELADGLEVADGSSLLGPVVVTEVDSSDEVAAWFALVLVEGDPLGVWQAYADQLSGRFPDAGIDVGPAPGCRTGPERIDDYDPGCSLIAHDSERRIWMTMGSGPGDVTGRYLLRLTGDAYSPPAYDDNGAQIPTGADELPPPQPARERPEVGEPLAPVTVAYEGDNEEYVLVEGSELLAQYGAGSITGGFAVMLRVRPDADLDQVVDAYIRQADQYDDVETSEETPPPAVTKHDDATVSVYHPPGGAGGYSGEVTVIDRPTGNDYILFELSND